MKMLGTEAPHDAGSLIRADSNQKCKADFVLINNNTQPEIQWLETLPLILREAIKNTRQVSNSQLLIVPSYKTQSFQ